MKKVKRKDWLFFPLVIAVIMVITFITHTRSSFKTNLTIPSGGITRLYTIGNSLVAVSSNRELYVWDWGNLKDEPVKIPIPSENSLWIPTGKLISVPVETSNIIVVSDSATNTELKRFNIGYGWALCNLNLSNNGQFIVAAFEKKVTDPPGDNSYKNIRIAMLSEDFNNLATVADLSAIILKNLAISDDGKFIAIVGQKHSTGWVAVAAAKQGEILWQNDALPSDEFTEVIFAPDNQSLYIAGIGRNIYQLGDAGKLLKNWQLKEYNIPPNQRQRVSCLDVSADGKMIAAGMTPFNKVFIWRTMDSKSLGIFDSGCNVLNGVAFSPDSLYYAVSGAVGSNALKVWAAPKD